MSKKIKTNIVKNGKYRFTKDRVFAIEPFALPRFVPEFQTNSNSLYIKNDYIIESDTALANLIKHKFIVKKKSINLTIKLNGLDITESYDEYEFHRPLKDERTYIEEDDKWVVADPDDDRLNENDCLKFAECLTFANQTYDMDTFNDLLQEQENPAILQSSSTKMPFGVVDFDNINILKNTDKKQKNNLAVPKNGESYAIVRKKFVEGYADYHIAFVLYTHKGINITLEAEADNRNNYQPKFSFYDTNADGNTFHRRWSAELFKNYTDEDEKERYDSLYYNGETIVLENRDISIVIKEIENEIKKNNDVKEIIQPQKIKKPSTLSRSKSALTLKRSRSVKSHDNKSKKRSRSVKSHDNKSKKRRVAWGPQGGSNSNKTKK